MPWQSLPSNVVLTVLIQGFSSWVAQMALSKPATSAAGELGAQGKTLGLA